MLAVKDLDRQLFITKMEVSKVLITCVAHVSILEDGKILKKVSENMIGTG